MAYAYLTTGATDLTAASWSDATGFATTATLAIETGSQQIVTNLDQSVAGTGLNYIEVKPGFSGDIGTPAAGSLKCDVDNGSDPHILYAASGGTFYLTAGGNNSTVTRLEVNTSGGTMRLTGGTFTTIDLIRGTMTCNASTVATSLYCTGGTSVVEYNATAITNLTISGGTHTIKRACTNVTITGGVVIVDMDGNNFGSTSLIQTGGTIILVAGNIPVATFIGGKLDPTRLRRPSTIAGTSAVIYNTFVGSLARAPGNQLTWTTANITYRGSYMSPGAPSDI